ncbi:2-acylglycerol O-acyltransferase 2-like isoform X2 [Zophobas morio]|uniref:2-acylglycerol O-acyltransferase 2-like isoform X2 n=1 Tax=Zophobas morio TaxID=2755281 RepID=UPI003083E851
MYMTQCSTLLKTLNPEIKFHNINLRSEVNVSALITKKMQIFGMELIPLTESLHRRKEALAAGVYFATFSYGGYLGVLFSIYLCFTRFWWLSLIYICSIYLDRKTCENGGRPSNWIQKLSWWQHLRNYFPVRTVLMPGFELHPNKNFLFCCFPHGVIPCGPISSLVTPGNTLQKRYPELILKLAGMELFFYLPFTKEIGLGLGGISCSAKSLTYVLNKPEGGYGVILYPGGAAEAICARPGQHRIVLKERKGFVKIALKTGASLVPVFTFGEVELFDQIQNPLICRCQLLWKKLFRYTLALPLGSGFFQTSFGLIPRRKPLFTVVGQPIDVARVENPTQEEIDELHQKFIKQLVNLFDTYKYDYLVDPEAKILELE